MNIKKKYKYLFVAGSVGVFFGIIGLLIDVFIIHRYSFMHFLVLVLSVFFVVRMWKMLKSLT